jgi:multiple sugar transport system substrate-binding protein
MSEVEVSFNNSYTDSIRVTRPLLAEFEQRHRARILLSIYDWETGWTELMKISLYKHGPVISQTGNSWMGSLIAQHSLRAFPDREISALGGKGRFLAGAWESCLDFDNKSVVAIPWVVDTYLVYYHRDQLAKAGIDEAGAFSTPENFHATLQKLQQAGFKYPFAVPTNASRSNIHKVSSWVWGQGGDFMDSQGKHMLLSEPGTRKGLNQYFGLYCFMPPGTVELSDLDAWNWFLEGKTAVTIRNAEFLIHAQHQEYPKELVANIGTAVLPGVPLLGGSNLVMWNHIRYEQEEDALAFIKFLTSAETQLSLFESSGLLPANLQALERVSAFPLFGPAIESVKKAKSFQRIRMWGLVEDKLDLAFAAIWTKLLTTPDPNLDEVIASELDPIEERLNLTLSQ